MRLLKTFSMFILAFVFLTGAAAFGQNNQTTGKTTSSTLPAITPINTPTNTTATVTPNKPAITPITNPSTLTTCKETKFAVSKNKKGTQRSNRKPPPRKPNPPTKPAQPPTPPVTVQSADFTDVRLNAGEETLSAGTVTLSDNTTADDYGKHLIAMPSPNLQAWFAGSTLHIFSPNGGNGRVVIFDKKGNQMDTVVVTSDPAAPTVAEQKIIDATNATAANTATIANTLNGLWWFGLIIVILLVLILLTGFFQRRGLWTAIHQFSNDTDDNFAVLRDDLMQVMNHYGLQPHARHLIIAERRPVAAAPANAGNGHDDDEL